MVAIALIVSTATAQPKPKGTPPTRNAPAITSLLALSSDTARQSTVEVICDGAPMTLGTVVDPTLVLTKASELFLPLAIRNSDGKRYSAKVLGVDDRYDLALLKIEAATLKPVVWAKADALSVGKWLITPTAPTDLKQVTVGVVSVMPRDLRGRGFLGVAFNTGRTGVRVGRVLGNSGALRAGVKVGDQVLQIDGSVIGTTNKAIEAIRKHRHGSTMKLTVKRGEKEMSLNVTLGRRPDFSSTRQKMMEKSAGRLSDRRTDFGTVFQHDGPIDPEHCGGPIIGLDGKAMGINIARAGRTAAYAIPASIIQALIEPLKTEKLSPTDMFELGMRKRRLDVRIWVVQKELATAKKRGQDHWIKKFGDELRSLQVERAKLK